MILNEDAVFSKSCKNPVYIVLMNGKSPLSSIILKATGDYFSHACIAFNDDLDPLYSFGAKSKTMQKGGMGFCISKPTDLSVFNKQAYYAVYVTYVTDEAYAKMKERLSYFTTNANKMIYDYVGLLNVWMHQSSDNRTRAYFCSRFVMDIIGAGIKLDKLPSLYRPQDIANMNNISLVNRGFDFHNYDKKITQKNEKLLKQGKLNPDDIIFESNILNESDIYYNKDKFDSGETNLCFVTGLSGSGKSTMANGMKAEHYELDDVGFNWNFSDDNLKDYGDLIYTFFKGIGKKYRVGYAEVDDSYASIYSDFVNYSIQYAKAHKNIKFVIEGVQLFQWINPKDLIDYAVYIKGTSRLISTYRAAKRNAGFENNTKDKINAIKKQVMGDLKYGKDFESRLKTWRKFFTNIQKKNIHEDVSSVIQKDFKSKHDMNLSQFEKMRLSDAAIQVYKQKLPSLSHVRINNNTKGYIWIDKKTDMPAAIVNVEEKDDGFTWIQAFEIFVPYKGHGLSKDILNVAIRELKATNLSVNKDNQVAIKIYKSYGFKTYKTTEYMYFMSIDKNAFDDDDDEDIYDESVIMESVSPKIYFLSESNMDGKTLLPRIPSNFMTKNGYEESKTPRVCFSTSIDGSLMGLSQNLKDKELYVHIPASKVNIYKPSVKQVPDCKITGEVWVKDKVNIKCIGKIKVIKDKGLPGHRYMYGDGKSAELYDWDWKWEEKYSVNESVIIESYNPHYTYSKLSSQKEISDFKNSMKIVFNSNDKPTDKLIKSMKKIEDNGTVIGYIGFSSYKIDGKKYLGIGNFMVLPQYQSKGYGANIITDIININKNKYDEIYCYVEESNTRAISFYKRVGKVGHLTDYGYYVTLYSSKSHVNESTIMESKNPYSKAIKDISSTPKIEYDRKAIRSKYSNIIFNSLKQQFSKKYKVCYTQVDNDYGMHDIVIYISTAVNAKEYYKSIDYGTNDYWGIIPQCTYTANKIYRIDDFNCYIILGDIIFFIYGAIVDNSGETNNTVEVDYCFDIDIVADLNTIGSKTNIEKSEALIVLQELMVNKIKDIKFDIYKDTLVFKNIDELVYNKISSKLKSPHYFNIRKVFNSKKQGTLYLISDKININESTIEDFEIEAETGFYDKHNRWNPIVIINGEQYRHRVECLIMRQNKLFVAKSNTGSLLIPGGGVDKSLSDEEQVYNECKEEARILVENIKPTGYAYLRRTGVSESAKRLPKEQQWVGSYTEIYIADYAKDFTGFIDYCDRDSEMIRGDFRPISEIIDKLVPEWKLALIDANYISVTTEALKSYKDPKLALKRRMGIKRNNAAKLGDFSNVAKSAPTPQAQTISVPSPAVSSSAPPSTKPAQTAEETEEIPETVKANANRLLCKEIASYPKFSGCYYNMDYPLYNGNGYAIVGWKMTGVHYNDFDLFNMYRDRIYEYCSKIFEDTNPGYGLKMDKKTNCIYITEI